MSRMPRRLCEGTALTFVLCARLYAQEAGSKLFFPALKDRLAVLGAGLAMLAGLGFIIDRLRRRAEAAEGVKRPGNAPAEE